MAVKITLYAENIAVGTEIVNFALKVGGALSLYDPTVDAPIANGNAQKKTYKRTDPNTLYNFNSSHEVTVAAGSVRERVWTAVEKLTLPLTRRQMVKQATAKCRKLDDKQVLGVIKFMIEAEILLDVTI